MFTPLRGKNPVHTQPSVFIVNADVSRSDVVRFMLYATTGIWMNPSFSGTCYCVSKLQLLICLFPVLKKIYSTNIYYSLCMPPHWDDIASWDDVTTVKGMWHTFYSGFIWSPSLHQPYSPYSDNLRLFYLNII